MPVNVTCTGCGQSFDAPDQYANRSLDCPQCGTAIEIPEPETANPRAWIILGVCIAVIFGGLKLWNWQANRENEQKVRELFENRGIELDTEKPKRTQTLLPKEADTVNRKVSADSNRTTAKRSYRLDEIRSPTPEELRALQELERKYTPPYKNAQHGFSIKFPEGWKIKGSIIEGTIVKSVTRDERRRLAFMSVSSSPTEAKQLRDLTWGIDDVANGFKSDATIPAALRKNMRLNVLGQGATEINNHPAIWTFLEVTEPAILSGYFLSHHLVHNDKLYRIMCTTDHEKSWLDQNIETFKASLESFEFIEN